MPTLQYHPLQSMEVLQARTETYVTLQKLRQEDD